MSFSVCFLLLVLHSCPSCQPAFVLHYHGPYHSQKFIYKPRWRRPHLSCSGISAFYSSLSHPMHMVGTDGAQSLSVQGALFLEVSPQAPSIVYSETG